MFLKDLLPIITLWPLFLGVGAFCEHTFLKKTKPTKNLSDVGYWFLLGTGVVTLSQFVVSLIGIPLWCSLLLLIPIALFGFWSQRKHFAFHISLGLWIVLVPFLFVLFTRSFSRATYTWDSIAFWTPKMFSLWQDQRVNKKTFEFFNHPEYPLLLPTIGADAYTLYGAPNEVAMKVTLFGSTLAFIILLNGFLSTRYNSLQRIGLLLFFLSIFVLREHAVGEYAGTADLLVGIYIAAGALCLLLKKPLHAMALWAFVPWAKTEGLVWALVSLSTTTLLYWKTLRKQIVIVVGIFILSGTWWLYTKAIGLSSQYFKFSEIYARPWVQYFIYSVHAFREEFRNLQKWNLLFFSFLAALGTSLHKVIKDKKLWILLLALAAQLVSYLIIFTITPEEQATFIAAAISRLSLHLAPVAFCMTAYLWKETKDIYEKA